MGVSYLSPDRGSMFDELTILRGLFREPVTNQSKSKELCSLKSTYNAMVTRVILEVHLLSVNHAALNI